MNIYSLQIHKLKSRAAASLVVLTAVYFSAVLVLAAPNPQINYQGKLTNASNIAVANASYQIEFSLYTVPTGGSPIWTETRSGVNEVAVTSGLFSVMLGSVTSLAAIDFNQPLYLGVTIEADAEMAPRKVFGTVPAAFEAINATTVGGVASTSILRNDRSGSISTSSAATLLSIIQNGVGDILNLFDGGVEVFSVLDGGNIGIGSTSPSSKLTVAGNTFIGGNLTATGTLTVSGTSTFSTTTVASSTITNLTLTNALSLLSGGTGFNTYATGDFIYASAANTLAKRTIGATGNIISVVGGVPTWVATSTLNIDFANTTGTLAATRGGTGLTTITQNQLLIGGAGNTWTQIATSSLGLASSFSNSAQLAALLNDESGTGVVAYTINPIFTTPNLGTPSTLVGTNITGTAAGLTAGTVTTNANLTGVITSTGNATALGSFTSANLLGALTDETGTGSVVFSISPTFTGTALFSSTTNSGRLSVLGTSTLATTTVAELSLAGALRDSTSASGTLGMLLQSTGTSTRWVATSTLGFSGGGVTNFLDLTDTPNVFTANRIFFTNPGATALTDSANFTFDGTNVGLGTLSGIAWNGNRVLYASTTRNNYLFGSGAGGALTTANNTIAIGSLSFQNATSAVNNIGIGTETGRVNTSGEANVFIGPLFTGYNNTTGSGNIFVGYAAGGNNTTGFTNTYIGNNAGNRTGSGNENTFYGANAGEYLATSSNSVIVGSFAAFGGSNYSANNLTVLGQSAGINLQTNANNNILIGFKAAEALTTGANNLIIGYDIDAPSNTGSNQLNIGNLIFGTGIDGTNTTLSTGNIGIGTSSPSAKLTVGGTMRVTGITTLATTTVAELALAGALRDSTSASGTLGMLLQSTGTSTRWVATSTLGISGGLTGIGPAGQIQSGPTVTFATSTGSFNGLTTGLTIAGTGNTITYTPSITGTLGNAGLTNSTISFTTGSTGSDINWTASPVALGGTATLNIPSAAAAARGLLTAADWTTFNGKISSSSLDTSAELAALIGDETGTGALVFAGSPTFTGTALFASSTNTGRLSVLGTTTLATTTIAGVLQMGTTSVESRFNLDVANFNTAGTAGLNRYYTSTNAASGTVQFGELAYSRLSTTATTTYVGSMFRVEDSTTRGNTVRGLEVQTNRGTNTQGENTALSGFARTFGVRGFTSGDAGSVFEPAGGYFETGGTTQGNAIRGYSATITSASLLSLFQDTSAFSGTGLLMNLGNGTGSFTGNFMDLQVAGVSRFAVASTGTMTLAGNIIPNTTLTQDIGSSSKRFNNVWAQTLNIGTSTWSIFNGANGRLAITDDGAQAGTERFSILTNGNVGIGTNVPGSRLTVSNNSSPLQAASSTFGNTVAQFAGVNGSQTRVLVDGYGAFPSLDFRRASGTAASPSGIGSSLGLGGISFSGYGTSQYSGTRAQILAVTSEAWTNTAQGAFLQFYTTPSGGTALTEQVRIDNSGKMTIFNGGLELAQGLDVDVGAVDTNPANNGTEGAYITDGYMSIGRNAGDALLLGRSDAGTIVRFYRAGNLGGNISINASNIVSYNAFTGSHYALTGGNIYPMGAVVALTGENETLENTLESEIVYGVEESTAENNPKIMGAYLGLLEPLQPESTSNPAQVMAVGNGDMWVVDQGEDLVQGDYLISSDIAGHAELDRMSADVSYVIARVSEDVTWDEVTDTVGGVKHKRIAVFFENFDRPNLDLALLASSTIDLTELTDETPTERFLAGLVDSLVAWFGNAQNGIGDMYANVFNASERICVDGECLTAGDIRDLKEALQNGGSTPPPPQTGGGGGGTGDDGAGTGDVDGGGIGAGGGGAGDGSDGTGGDESPPTDGGEGGSSEGGDSGGGDTSPPGDGG